MFNPVAHVVTTGLWSVNPVCVHLDQCFWNYISRVPLSQSETCTLPLSQYNTCTRTTVTIQNMYTYHCHNTKHVHIPLPQYKTCTRTTVTIQNMYYCQYKTCTCTTVTIQNMYTYQKALQTLMPTFRILVFPDVSPTGETSMLCKPQISQLLIF
jgi:hypothetical protein